MLVFRCLVLDVNLLFWTRSLPPLLSYPPLELLAGAVSGGLLCSSHQPVLSAHQVLAIKKEVSPAELDFLLRFPSKAGVTSPVDFLQPQGWGGIKVGHGSWCSPKCSIVVGWD